MKEYDLGNGTILVKLPDGTKARVKYCTRALIYTIDNEIAKAAIEHLREQAYDADRG